MTSDIDKGEPAAAASAGLWSAEAALLVRPFSTYRALAGRRHERTWRDLVRGVLFQAALLGAFVSLTSAGRLVASHILLTAVFWGFLPLLQVGAVAAAVRSASRREPLVPALSLYFDGLGPWYVFYLALSGICLFAPDVYGAFTGLMRVGALPLFLVFTILWGFVITCAFFRDGLALPRGLAARAAAVFYLIFVGVIVGWYLAMNEIQPQVWGT